MNTHSRLALIVYGCFALSWPLCLVGCRSQQPDTTPSPKTDNGYTSWASQAPKKSESIPGIDFATVDWGTWNDGLLFAVWVDRDPKPVASSGRGITGSKTGPGLWDAKYRVWCDPPKVNVECDSTDGTSGSLTVNGGQRLDLSQGRLFLVSTAGGEVRVKQLNRDGLSAKQGAQDTPPECFVKLKDDPEVKAFFAKSAGNPK
jgi:hypothetical protein